MATTDAEELEKKLARISTLWRLVTGGTTFDAERCAAAGPLLDTLRKMGVDPSDIADRPGILLVSKEELDSLRRALSTVSDCPETPGSEAALIQAATELAERYQSLTQELRSLSARPSPAPSQYPEIEAIHRRHSMSRLEDGAFIIVFTLLLGGGLSLLSNELDYSYTASVRAEKIHDTALTLTDPGRCDLGAEPIVDCGQRSIPPTPFTATFSAASMGTTQILTARLTRDSYFSDKGEQFICGSVGQYVLTPPLQPVTEQTWREFAQAIRAENCHAPTLPLPTPRPWEPSPKR